MLSNVREVFIESGPAWTRTRDRFLIREVRLFLMGSVLYENPSYLRRCEVTSVLIFRLCPAPFWLGCCTG